LKARVDLGDQTAEFIPFEVISTAILMYFYLLLGADVRILVSVINTRFPLDAPRRCTYPPRNRHPNETTIDPRHPLVAIRIAPFSIKIPFYNTQLQLALNSEANPAVVLLLYSTSRVISPPLERPLIK
jgi:hypothetical protein